MSEKYTSSKPIKVFAKVIFVFGLIFTILMTAGIIVAGIGYANTNATQYNGTALTILSIVCGIVFFLISLLLLMVEKAMLMSYAEIAEDMREVRNILERRDSKS